MDGGPIAYRVRMPGGGEVEVATLEDAARAHPDGEVLYGFGRDGAGNPVRLPVTKAAVKDAGRAVRRAERGEGPVAPVAAGAEATGATGPTAVRRAEPTQAEPAGRDKAV